MPNPASVYCKQQGNKLEIRTADDGSQSGVCVFVDGNTCDEWAYYQGECGPATPVVAVEATAKASGGEEQALGAFMPPGITEEIAGWWGVIKSTEPGAQYDDYFERQDLGQIIYFAIDSMDPAVKSQIEALRNSGKIVHLYGTLLSNVPDYNGSQILVVRIGVDGQSLVANARNMTMNLFVKILMLIGNCASIGFGIWHFLCPLPGSGIPILISMRPAPHCQT